VLVATCPRCDGGLPERAHFCTGCGLRLDGGLPPTSAAPISPPQLLACPVCGASNAASRRRCGRCDDDLHATPAASRARVASPAALLEAPPVDDGPTMHGQSGAPIVFSVVVTVAGLAILGVMGSMLHASGDVGVFAATGVAPPPTEVSVPVSSVRASSVAGTIDGEAFEPANLLDGDPTTVWRDGTDGSGVGEWVELRLDGTPEVNRLVLWNGDQRAGAFAGTTRAVRIRIDVDDRMFTAELLEVDGPQAVDLPETVAASSVRVTMLEIFDGAGNLAISDIELRGPPPSGADAED
jgi:hypothetical protein